MQVAYRDARRGMFDFAAAHRIVPAINQLAAGVRQAGGSVFWVQHTVPADDDWTAMIVLELPAVWKRRVEVLAEGAEGQRVHESLDVRAGDQFCLKRRYSVFFPGCSDQRCQCDCLRGGRPRLAITVRKLAMRASRAEVSQQAFVAMPEMRTVSIPCLRRVSGRSITLQDRVSQKMPVLASVRSGGVLQQQRHRAGTCGFVVDAVIDPVDGNPPVAAHRGVGVAERLGIRSPWR